MNITLEMSLVGCHELCDNNFVLWTWCLDLVGRGEYCGSFVEILMMNVDNTIVETNNINNVLVLGF